MTLPGFTADSSYYRTAGLYRVMAGNSGSCARPSVSLARDNRKSGTEASVDCKSFPDGITCHECNAFGPGTFDCCELRGMRNPGDSCIIVNDPNAEPARPTSRFSRGSAIATRFTAQL